MSALWSLVQGNFGHGQGSPILWNINAVYMQYVQRFFIKVTGVILSQNYQKYCYQWLCHRNVYIRATNFGFIIAKTIGGKYGCPLFVK